MDAFDLDGMFYTNEDGVVKLWYPDGDELATVQDNLGMGVTAEDVAKLLCALTYIEPKGEK